MCYMSNGEIENPSMLIWHISKLFLAHLLLEEDCLRHFLTYVKTLSPFSMMWLPSATWR